ncbi:sigma factor-like helix-turn-helix DNA-binding protein [Amycolatopsis sp. NPDC049688]|uniref:sigma factor-like helix-turn-helix DNA-binding protein n=1 Tax=Amycolatopsis sp. NPDC049688 TaxID=3154733 RepID=UPI00342A8256
MPRQIGPRFGVPLRHTLRVIPTAEFDTERQRLFGLAYRLLGVADEAEDVVEDAYLSWEGANHEAATHPDAWLIKAVTRLCVGRLGAVRATRAHNLGSWLPAPVLTATLGPLATAEQRDSLSLALLVLLEHRTPHERAVFVLRNAVECRYRAIAEILELSPGNCRQLYHRTTLHLANRRMSCQPVRAERVRLAEQFLVAIKAGDVIGLEAILAEDVTVWADGVRRVATVRHPVVGRHRVVRYLVAAFRKIAVPVRFGLAEVNASTAILALTGGTLLAVVAPEIDGGRIVGLRIVASPDKLSSVAKGLSAPTGRMSVLGK